MEIYMSPRTIKMQPPTNWYRHEFIPADSQMYNPDGRTIGVKAMYVRFPVPQDHDLARVTVEKEIPQEDPVIVAVHIEKKPLLHHFHYPCIMRDIRPLLRASFPLRSPWPPLPQETSGVPKQVIDITLDANEK
jgi:hypothetical protein